MTVAHHRLLAGRAGLAFLGGTCLLGGYFLYLQGLEYNEAPFSFADSVYGSVFFLATGFHGAHVIAGTAFLLVALLRAR